MNYSDQHLRKWLINRPLISIRGLEERSGCPLGTIRHFLKNRRSLPGHFRSTISKELALYGYAALGGE